MIRRRTFLGSVLPALIALWAVSGAQPVLAEEKGTPPGEKAKAEEPKGKVAEAKKAVKADLQIPTAKESTGGAKEKAADKGKAVGKAASEAAGKVKDNSLAQEKAKHLKRMAQIDRLEKVAKDKKSENSLKKIAMLREKELQRHERALTRLGKEKGGKASEEPKKKTAEGKKKEKGEQ